jgi:hypothetical protein
VDELAPPLWSHLTASHSPEDFFYSLNNEEKAVIDRWRAKRSAMLQRRIQQEVHSRIEDEESLVRNSTPFLRLLVTSHDRSLLNPLDREKINCRKEDAIITIWSPTEEQMSLFREGAAIRAENLSTRQYYDGRLQLAANGRTNISLRSSTSVSRDILSLCYTERTNTSLFQIHICSRRQLQRGNVTANPFGVCGEHDVTGVILKVVESESKEKTSVYLTDMSKLVVRVQCGGMKSIGDTLGLRSPVARLCVAHPRVVAFRDLTVLPFDEVENCAVVEFRAVSSIRSDGVDPISSNLHQWVESSTGRARLICHAAYLDAGLLTLQRPQATFTTLVGYIAGFKVQPSQHLRVLVDAGIETIQEFAFPFHLLPDVVLPNSKHETVSLNAEEEGLCSKLKFLGTFFRARGILHRFLLKRAPQTITSYRSCEFEVCQINAIDIEALCGVYEAMHSS